MNQIDDDLNDFSEERCHENLVTSAELSSFSVSSSEAVPEVSAMSAPTDFYSAIEAEKMEGQDWDMRPHLYDKVTKQYLLLDSGAQVTAYPPDPGDTVDPTISLKAVNGSKLRCYGYKEVNVQINRKTYRINAIKTDVPNPILGWNFQRKHRLDVTWTHCEINYI